jgi:hypothetical protein
VSKDPIKTLEMLEKKLDKTVASILNDCAFKIHRWVTSSEFGGLHWRTRRRPIVVKKARLKGSVITAEVRAASGWTYGHIFIGPPGQTTITAKGGGFMALPTEFVKQIRGTQVGPRQYSGTVTFGGVIWGRAGWGKGSFDSKAFRWKKEFSKTFKELMPSLVPLFILKKSVIIKRRIISSILVKRIRPYFLEQLKKRALNVNE